MPRWPCTPRVTQQCATRVAHGCSSEGLDPARLDVPVEQRASEAGSEVVGPACEDDEVAGDSERVIRRRYARTPSEGATTGMVTRPSEPMSKRGAVGLPLNRSRTRSYPTWLKGHTFTHMAQP